MDAVHRYEGTVSRLDGRRPDGAVRRARSRTRTTPFGPATPPWRMQDAVRRLRRGGPPRARHHASSIRVGLNSGEVVVRHDPRRPAHGLHRDGPDRPPGLADGAAGRAGHGRADRRDAGAGGRVRPGPLARAGARSRGCPSRSRRSSCSGPGTARTRLQAAAARGLTRFVGRDAEIAALYAALDAGRSWPRPGRGAGRRAGRRASRGWSGS